MICGSDSVGQKVMATIGMFDGVHLGHQWLIADLKARAASLGLGTAIITFRDHPHNVLRPDKRLKMLMSASRRLECLRATGVSRVIDMDFTPELSTLGSAEFMELISRRYGVAALLVGYNHRFGHNRDERFAQYQANGARLGVRVEQAAEYAGPEAPVSSSIVRDLVKRGEVAAAAAKMGSPLRLAGRVVHGYARGRDLGFPTANIEVDPALILPRCGAYAVMVETPDGQRLCGMANIGTRPTFSGGESSVEVNIFGFSGDVYGRMIAVDFVERLRDERPMASAEELRAQLLADRLAAARLLDAASKGR